VVFILSLSRFKIGDRAAFSMGIGAYAEAMNLLEMQLVPIQDGVSDAQAASVLLKGMTVEFLFHHTYPLHGGETILFHAAAGGVGLLACQWARDIGVHLIGTASTQEKCDLAMQNGAAASFISDDPQLPALLREASGGEGFPVVYDSVGKASFQTSLEALKPFGMFVSFGNASGPVDPIAPSLLAAHGSLYFTRPTLATYVADITRMQVSAQKVFDKVVTGKLSVQINQTYALSDIQQAHRDLEARKTTGCSVIIP
jgi:NADPH:quinone reductase